MTGEHSAIVLHPLKAGKGGQNWIDTYWTDFHRRFVSLLSFNFRKFSPDLALSVLERTSALPSNHSDSEESMYRSIPD